MRDRDSENAVGENGKEQNTGRDWKYGIKCGNMEIVKTEQVGAERIIIKAGPLVLIAKSKTKRATFAMSLVRFPFDFLMIGNASSLSRSCTQTRGYFRY